MEAVRRVTIELYIQSLRSQRMMKTLEKCWEERYLWMNQMSSEWTLRSTITRSRPKRWEEKLLTILQSTRRTMITSMPSLASLIYAKRPRFSSLYSLVTYCITLSLRICQDGIKSSNWSLMISCSRRSSTLINNYLKGKSFYILIITYCVIYNLFIYLYRIHVSMANFHDTLIDYPNSKDYSY